MVYHKVEEQKSHGHQSVTETNGRPTVNSKIHNSNWTKTKLSKYIHLQQRLIYINI